MKTVEQIAKKVNWVQIKTGEDLLESITQFCQENNIQAGIVLAIGALQKAKFGYYDQKEKIYLENSIEEPVEIVSCLGNISLKEGKPFVHAHISLANKEGKVFGGHLNPGCTVFACECSIIELEGKNLERKFEQITGLSLWDFS